MSIILIAKILIKLKNICNMSDILIQLYICAWHNIDCCIYNSLMRGRDSVILLTKRGLKRDKAVFPRSLSYYILQLGLEPTSESMLLTTSRAVKCLLFCTIQKKWHIFLAFSLVGWDGDHRIYI